ncbi:TetR/AcrR family transcriptional regulator [Nocardia otitidiscaviarum]|uniref:TetR/AcrR family transcriptional regulator n=1 Tax=Nocardia otitidiscaviarum TaxID=1823 RepID=UPI002B4B5603|nr:TetR/AcrR family transcriptional regulator [Nocardia otitidiscaviarum]
MAGRRLRAQGHRGQGRDREIVPRRGRPPQSGLPLRRRRQIVEAAYAVFSARGYEASTVSAIAAQAGIAQGTVYRYFHSKREILDHVLDFGVDKLMEAWQPQTFIGVAGSAVDLIDGVRAGADRLHDLVEREPELLRLLLVEASAVDPELARRLLGLEAMVAAWVAGELQRGMDGGWLRPDIDADVLSHTIVMLILPDVVRELLGTGTPRVRKQSTDMVLIMVEKALRVRAVDG